MLRYLLLYILTRTKIKSSLKDNPTPVNLSSGFGRSNPFFPSPSFFRVDQRSNRLFGQNKNDQQSHKSELSYFLQNPDMIKLLNEKGIQRFFPVQYETFDDIYAGNDVIARDRTGSGKTIAFSLPIIERFRKEKIF